MIRLDKEIAILVISFFALCTVAALMTANSKNIISGIEASRDQTPTEKLLNNIPSGCSFENCSCRLSRTIEFDPVGADHIRKVEELKELISR